jgi:hypothetical protein
MRFLPATCRSCSCATWGEIDYLEQVRDNRGILEALLSDGRFLLQLTGVALLLSGGFAIFQSITGYFLPQDVQALGFDAQHLASISNHQVVYFMFHDRVSFGGTLLAIGSAYWFLVEFPLRNGEPWAWWTFCISGAAGFASFLTYLSYGYLDTWHGLATLFLLPFFLAGLWCARPARIAIRDAWHPGQPRSLARLGLGFLGVGLIAAGGTIMVVGMTSVFVPQDLAFMMLSREEIRHIAPQLIPVIAHDRAGFGGGLFSTGMIILMLARHAPMAKSTVQIVAIMGIFGFGAALGVHHVVGYTDLLHLSPAYAGSLLFLATLARLIQEYRAEYTR